MKKIKTNVCGQCKVDVKERIKENLQEEIQKVVEGYSEKYFRNIDVDLKITID